MPRDQASGEGIAGVARSNPPCIENKSQKRSLALDQPERCPGYILTERGQRDGSPAEALSNQYNRWCCIDRLSWHGESGVTGKLAELTSAGSRATDLGLPGSLARSS
jgi:hypothetical protein